MPALGIRSEDKYKTNSLCFLMLELEKEKPDNLEEIINSEITSMTAKGYQFKADGKTLDIPILILN